jgi:hypothetical protein
VAAAPGEPGQRREGETLHPRRRERRLHLVLELAPEQREVERPREPFIIVRPCSASATAVSNSCSILSAGRMSTRTSAGSSPTFAKSCGTPGGTTTTSPLPAATRLRRILKRTVPATTSKRSSCFG